MRGMNAQASMRICAGSSEHSRLAYAISIKISCAGQYTQLNIIQLFHTFLCTSHNYHPRGAVDDPMHCCPRPKAKGNSASGQPQHRGGDSFDCCTERFEIVVLLPNSELTNGNNKRDIDARTVRHGGSGSLNPE